MRADFSGRAARLAGIAARMLGWRPDDFWAATPAELALSLAPPDDTAVPPSRDEIDRMMERDGHG